MSVDSLRIVLFSDIVIREFVFVLVRWPNSMFSRYAEQVLLMGPIVEGLVGSYPAFSGVIHA